jgi:hypothetical protein
MWTSTGPASLQVSIITASACKFCSLYKFNAPKNLHRSVT